MDKNITDDELIDYIKDALANGKAANLRSAGILLQRAADILEVMAKIKKA